MWTVLLLSLLGGNRFEGEWLVPIEQLCAPVEMGTHEDFVFGFGQWAIFFEDLVVSVFVANAPVVLQDTFVFDAEDVVEVDAFGKGTMIVFFFQGFNGELIVEAVGETVGQ